ncbi:MAG: undecaprenyl/decaprenyl-phosphate alpha-N-acetylglucosaminyl 1-phosphate transferase [Desulfuromonadales bacterium]|nr:undecaprenyl/decaprenyl-phosphate alpha-N-acetylglucosaminyl 1-phosphate transferase [Desulfuromonadales bacterium]
MDLVKNCYIFMTALFAALIMVPPLRRWALQSGNVDQPDARKVHSSAIPRIGGIAIFMSFLFSCLVFVDLVPPVRGILAGGLVIFCTGLIDDISGLTPKHKFLGEIVACLVAIFVGGLHIHTLGNLFGTGPIILPFWVAIPFTVFAVVGVINAINLLDGLDGLAGGVSVIALTCFAILAYQNDNSQALMLCIALLGALLGFLKYNFFPARIFMGDTGSLGLGFALGFMAVYLTQLPASRLNPVVPVLILALPILDTIWVMIHRLLHRTSPFAPDQSHLHHKFLNLGFQHRYTVIFIYGISLFWGMVAILFRHADEHLLLLTYLGVTLSSYVLLRYMLRHKERFAFLRFDSALGFRQAVRYRRLAEIIDTLATVLFALLIVYLGMILYVTFAGGQGSWQVAKILYAAVALLLILTRDWKNSYLLAMLFACVLELSYGVETYYLLDPVVGGFLREGSNLIFLVMAVIGGLKLFFRKDGDFFVSTVDILIIGLLTFLSIIFHQLSVSFDLALTLLKGVVLYVALKVVLGRYRRR